MIDPLSRQLHARSRQHGPLLLMYHSVVAGNATPTWPWAVSSQAFCAQLDFLAGEGYATPTLAELVATPALHFRSRVAVVTFDDGYTDNLAAADELARRGMRASWFVVTGAIGKRPNWPLTGGPATRLLNADELRALDAMGMEIGSHTVHHARLPELDNAALADELRDSRSGLEDALGHSVSGLAYPYGAWDARCAKAAADAGYASACTTRSGWAMRDGDPYRIRRLTVFNTDSLAVFARKLSLARNEAGWPSIVSARVRQILRPYS